MRSRALVLIALAVAGGLGGLLTYSGVQGEPPAPPRELPPNLRDPAGPQPEPAAPAVQPTTGSNTPSPAKAAERPRAPAPIDRFRNFDVLSPVTQQMLLSVQRGIEWLHRMNQPSGRFLHGYVPALNQPMEGDHFLRQATAAFVLARAARFTGEERHAVRAAQAILSLLAETKVDPAAPGMRMPTAPSVICNRLAACGYLVMAIHELPEPTADLLARSDELCAFIRAQQRADGSLCYTDKADENDVHVDPDGINHYPGAALYGIALSQHHRPAPWKGELIRKSFAYYYNWFRAHPHPVLVPWLTAAYAEAFLQTKEAAYADFVCGMNDWLIKLQYDQLDPRHPDWRGGFRDVNARGTDTMPSIDTALYAQSLADCCLVIRHMPNPDTGRYERCRTALVRALQFTTTLQFAEGNTQHFAPNYRPMLVGGFHASPRDGNLRVDQSAHAVSALIQFLMSGAEKE
jgi:hypothetical protein